MHLCTYIYTQVFINTETHTNMHHYPVCLYLCAILHLLCPIINSILLHHLLHNLKHDWEKNFSNCLYFLPSFPLYLDIQSFKEGLLQTNSVPAMLFYIHINKLLVSLITGTLPKHYLLELQEHFCKVF